MNDYILITGATGQQGGAVARHLISQGQKVRAFTRNPAKAAALKQLGAEVVQGDLLDRESLDNALRGVKKMYLVTTPFELGIDNETEQGLFGAEAAKDAGIEHLVFSSVGSANRNTGIPHLESKWVIEQRIHELGLPATILRPVFFMENFGSAYLLPAVKAGMIALPMGETKKLALVAVDTIGAFGAMAFMRSENMIGEEIELAGDEKTLPEIVALIAKATGKPLAYKVLPHEGADKIFGDDFAKMYKWFDEVGYHPDLDHLMTKYKIPLLRFADYLKTAAWVKEV